VLARDHYVVTSSCARKRRRSSRAASAGPDNGTTNFRVQALLTNLFLILSKALILS